MAISKGKPKIKCLKCGLEYNVGDFYNSNSNVYKDINGKLPICKNCLTDIYNEMLDITNDIELAVKTSCMKTDVYYNQKIFIGANEQSKIKNSIVMKVYMQKINSLKQYDGLTYSDTIREEIATGKGLNINSTKEDEIKTKQYELVKKETEEKLNIQSQMFKNKDIFITDEDLNTQHEITTLLGYDPFIGYEALDRKFLYSELLPYLDEDTLEDQFKVSVIVQIVNNNNQVRKIDYMVNQLSSDLQALLDNKDEIAKLTDIKNKIVTANDKLSKENSISLKNRVDKKAGQSTLGAIMKKYRENGFGDAEEDFFDMLTCNAMRQCADISNKSICEQLNFDEKDVEDMFFQQRELIQKLQMAELEQKNKIRLLTDELEGLKRVDNS